MTIAAVPTKNQIEAQLLNMTILCDSMNPGSFLAERTWDRNWFVQVIKQHWGRKKDGCIAFTFCTWSHVATAWTDMKTVWVHNMIYSDAQFQ